MRHAPIHSLSLALLGLFAACNGGGRSAQDGGTQPAPAPEVQTPPADGPPPDPDPGGQQAPAAATTLRGKVVQAGTNTPLEGIQVTFRAQQTTTDAEGVFALTLEKPLAPGERHALIAADMDGSEHGGDHHSGSVRVAAGEDGSLPEIPDDTWMIRLRKR